MGNQILEAMSAIVVCGLCESPTVWDGDAMDPTSSVPGRTTWWSRAKQLDRLILCTYVNRLN